MYSNIFKYILLWPTLHIVVWFWPCYYHFEAELRTDIIRHRIQGIIMRLNLGAEHKNCYKLRQITFIYRRWSKLVRRIAFCTIVIQRASMQYVILVLREYTEHISNPCVAAWGPFRDEPFQCQCKLFTMLISLWITLSLYLIQKVHSSNRGGFRP